MPEPRTDATATAHELVSMAALETARPKRPAPRKGAGQWALIGLVLFYAVILLLGPLASLMWGAFDQGLGQLVTEITTPDALHALKLTLILSVVATVVNTVVGVCAAWLFVRDDFRGRRFLNGIVDTPFAVSPVIAGFMLWGQPSSPFAGYAVITPWGNFIGACIMFALGFVPIYVVAAILNRMGLLRVPIRAEIDGLDFHNNEAYRLAVKEVVTVERSLVK